MTHDHNDEQVTRTTEQARQGETPGVVRYVLGFGLLGVVVAFSILWYYFQRP